MKYQNGLQAAACYLARHRPSASSPKDLIPEETSRCNQKYWRKLSNTLGKLNVLEESTYLKRGLSSLFFLCYYCVCIHCVWPWNQIFLCPLIFSISHHSHCISGLFSPKSGSQEKNSSIVGETKWIYRGTCFPMLKRFSLVLKDTIHSRHPYLHVASVMQCYSITFCTYSLQ